jgi:hypothetical protein
MVRPRPLPATRLDNGCWTDRRRGRRAHALLPFCVTGAFAATGTAFCRGTAVPWPCNGQGIVSFESITSWIRFCRKAILRLRGVTVHGASRAVFCSWIPQAKFRFQEWSLSILSAHELTGIFRLVFESCTNGQQTAPIEIEFEFSASTKIRFQPKEHRACVVINRRVSHLSNC